MPIAISILIVVIALAAGTFVGAWQQSRVDKARIETLRVDRDNCKARTVAAEADTFQAREAAVRFDQEATVLDERYRSLHDAYSKKELEVVELRWHLETSAAANQRAHAAVEQALSERPPIQADVITGDVLDTSKSIEEQMGEPPALDITLSWLTQARAEEAAEQQRALEAAQS